MTADPRSIADLVDDLLALEKLAADIDTDRKTLRAELEARARAEAERSGAAPTWKTGGGTVSWVTRHGRPQIIGPAAYLGWVMSRRPDAVEQKVADWHTNELAKAAVVVDGQLVTDDGEIVPGLIVGPDSQYLSVRLKK